MIDNYNDDINVPHKLLLTNTQVLRLRKALVNNLSGHRKSAKTKLSKMVELARFLGRLLQGLLKDGL